VQKFADDIVSSLKKMTKIMNNFTLKLFKPFIGKNNYKLLSEFILPLIKTIVENREKNTDILFYNAPTVILFYTTPLNDKEDSIIASTLATTAAETLGLGTCIIGTVPPALNNDQKLKSRYGLSKDEKVAMAFILGYPERSFSKGIKRRFKEVRYQ
jgi:nitroreductase